MSTPSPLKLSFIAVLALSCTGCEFFNSLFAPPPKQMATRSVTVPEVVPQPETQIKQDKSGLSISVTPVPYDVKRDPDAFKLTGAAQNQNDPNMYRMTWQPDPQLLLEPDRLAFKVQINNQMNRVFRGAGTVVQFVIDAQTAAVDSDNYASLTGAMIAPRQFETLEIYGPPLSRLEDGDQIGVFFYDVVTEVDQAGNVVDKANFEWYFTYKQDGEPVTEEFDVTPKSGMATQAQVEEMRRRSR